ncbi:DUF3649 domain-containing protein [Variovorax boronicumulans]|uniref:DUF3649 domain-containing protein n=1 Tax=Variovorax boronicumulans TaxID=436515 RepID=UPI00117F6994|nr:DUF3649 domain-containing protein [Variovorax boronicumulans]
MTSRQRTTRALVSLVSRIVAALCGGYALAALSSVSFVALPMSKSDAVLAGMMLSFSVYTGAVVWVFAVRSAVRAWVGLLVAAAPLMMAAWPVWKGGGA